MAIEDLVLTQACQNLDWKAKISEKLIYGDFSE
jgi:hypothetical protein